MIQPPLNRHKVRCRPVIAPLHFPHEKRGESLWQPAVLRIAGCSSAARGAGMGSVESSALAGTRHLHTRARCAPRWVAFGIAPARNRDGGQPSSQASRGKGEPLSAATDCEYRPELVFAGCKPASLAKARPAVGHGGTDRRGVALEATSTAGRCRTPPAAARWAVRQRSGASDRPVKAAGWHHSWRPGRLCGRALPGALPGALPATPRPRKVAPKVARHPACTLVQNSVE